MNCNDYSVSDPSIWLACQIDDSCNDGDDGISELEDLESEPVEEGAEEVVGCEEEDSCVELTDEQPFDESNEGVEEVQEEVLAEDPTEEALIEIEGLADSGRVEANSDLEGSELSGIEAISDREIRILSNLSLIHI